MRLLDTVLVIGFVLIAACGDSDNRSPRELCLDTEQEVNEAAKQCNPQSGSIDLSCNNFGTGSRCEMIDEYFACMSSIRCDNGTVVLPTNCQLGACE